MYNNKSSLAALVAGIVSSCAYAQQPIERLTVTANKFEQPIEQVLASIDVITRDDIERASVKDLPALLSNYAGIDIVRNGGLGQNSSLFLRGAGSSHSLVVIDGVRVGSASLGYKALSTVPLNSIERVEIIRGSRAAWYGSDALAGVINIITRNGDSQSVSVSSGSDDYYSAQGAFGWRQNNWQLALNAGHEQTQGYDVTSNQYPDDDGYENTNVGLNFNYDAGRFGQLNLVAQYSEGDVEYDSDFEDLTEFEKYHILVGWQKQHGQFAHKMQLSTSSDQDHNQYQYPTEFSTESIFDTQRDELNYQLTYQWQDNLTLSGGLDYYQEDVGDSYSPYAGEDQNSSGFVVEERDNTGVYLGGYYEQGIVNTNLVLRHDDHETFGGNTTYNAAVGIALSPIATFRASYGTGFKAPTFSQSASIWGVNEDLEAEKSASAELGLTINLESAQYDIAIYHNELDNQIAYANFGYYNIAESSFQGVELSASFVDPWGVNHHLNASYVDAQDDVTKEQLVLRAKRALNWGLTKDFDKWQLGAQLQYRSDRLSYYRTELPSYTLVNVSAQYAMLSNLGFKLGVDNVLNKEYATNVAAVDFQSGEPTSMYVGAERKVYGELKWEF